MHAAMGKAEKVKKKAHWKDPRSHALHVATIFLFWLIHSFIHSFIHT